MQVLAVADVWAAMTDTLPNLWKVGRTMEDCPWAKVSRWHLDAMMTQGEASNRKPKEREKGERRRIR
jgi:hypothetical protein